MTISSDPHGLPLTRVGSQAMHQSLMQHMQLGGSQWLVISRCPRLIAPVEQRQRRVDAVGPGIVTDHPGGYRVPGCRFEARRQRGHYLSLSRLIVHAALQLNNTRCAAVRQQRDTGHIGLHLS